MIQRNSPSFLHKLGDHTRGTFVIGGLILVPIAITYVLARWAFDNIDGLLQPALHSALGREIPGLGLITLALLTYLAGLVWRKRLGRRIIGAVQRSLAGIPVIGAVYGPARQLTESFTGKGGAGFKRVVIVEYPKEETWMVGFLTGVSHISPGSALGIVYVPTAPTPNSGWVALIPIHQIYDTTMTVQEAMSMVLSGGIAAPSQIDISPLDPSEAMDMANGVNGAARRTNGTGFVHSQRVNGNRN